jgi:hypothetical protein
VQLMLRLTDSCNERRRDHPPKEWEVHDLMTVEGVPKPSKGVVLRRTRLGGILSHYYRRAA